MSYAAYPHNQYSRAPTTYQRSGYADPNYADVEQDYPQQSYPQQTYQQGYSQQTYPQHSRSYAAGGHDRHHHHHQSSGRHQRYTTVDPQYVTSSRSHHHHQSSRHSHSRRHTPNVIIAGSSHNLADYTTASYAPTSSSRYRAEGRGGQYVPVTTSHSYRNEWVSLSDRIRRLFGIGPKRHSGHRGVTVHVSRGSNDKYSHRGRPRVYTI